MTERVVHVNAEVVLRHAEPVMGTVVSFRVHPGRLAPGLAWAAVRDACRVLHRADEVFSLYRSDSSLSRLRRGEISLDDCPPEVSAVLACCRRARKLSGGWFDPWSLPGGFDPTGLVKGWAAQEAVSVLQDAGLAAAMINAAGDLATFGSSQRQRPWRVGVRSPEAADRLLCVVESAGALATSGCYERGEHVLDPNTGKPASGTISATVSGTDLAVADALASGLLAAGKAGFDSVRSAGYEALIIQSDASITHTEGFPFARRLASLAGTQGAGVRRFGRLGALAPMV